jgi:hypothetical protein
MGIDIQVCDTKFQQNHCHNQFLISYSKQKTQQKKKHTKIN